MDKKIEVLKKWGCNIESALELVSYDEDFYMECLEMINDDPNFDKLKQALNEKNIDEAFFYAHTLKGVLANLGLTPMYNKVIEIVEPLRERKINNLTDKLEQLYDMKDYLTKILKG